MSDRRLLRGLAYGLAIDSSIPLPRALAAGPGVAAGDVSVTEGRPNRLREVPPTSLGHRFIEGRASLACGDGLFISVAGGARIVVPRGINVAHFQSSLIGPVLGTVIIQRGWLALHASAVAFEGDVALAVCAPSGGGKSVTAAACFLQGDPLVTDDVLALPFGDIPPDYVVPAFPLVRLWPEGATALGLDPESLDVIDPDLGKLVFHAEKGFRRDPRRLGAIVILESSGTEVSASELEGGEAVAALVEHSYGVSAIRQTGRLARHFEQITDLVRRVPVARLRLPPATPPSDVADAVHGVGSDLVGSGVPRVS